MTLKDVPRPPMRLRCELCGDHYHEEPDPLEEAWMGLRCPGALASNLEQAEFLQALTDAYARWVQNQSEVLDNREEWLAERKRLWYERKRSEATHGQLIDDCDKTTRELSEHMPWNKVNSSTPVETILDMIEADLIEEASFLTVGEKHIQVPSPPITPNPELTKNLSPLIAKEHRASQAEDMLLYFGDKDES